MTVKTNKSLTNTHIDTLTPTPHTEEGAKKAYM